ncbi:MAG: hypothetical protein RL681_111 [Candidatus Parcubacteria bacterium]|jgi:lipopolysaccharide biosynthesis glycosyltransferase
MATETVAVVFSSDDTYAMLLGVALCSLFENKKGDYPIHVFVIDGGISAKNKERLGILKKRYNFAITYVIPDKRLFASIPVVHLPLEAYYRIAIGRMIPSTYRRAVYLDCDVIVRKDIIELFTADLAGKTVGAVADCLQDVRKRHLEKLCRSIALLEIPEKLTYFNSGVLLIDMERWREREIEEKLFAFICRHPELWAADQDALNIVLLGDRTILAATYNLLAEFAHEQNEKDPLIVHFVGGGKPWYLLSALPYQSEYVRYANKTPWKKEKYRKLMDVPFAKKYHLYPIVWSLWTAYKKTKGYFSAGSRMSSATTLITPMD